MNEKDNDLIRRRDAHKATHNYHVSEINAIPAVDAVEVVRCRDCIYYKESELLGPTKFCYRLKDRDGKPIGYNFAGSDFCSYGQRREGGDDT